MNKVELDNYEHIIFDFDGVIADSNKFKEQNIREACEKHLEISEISKFCEYFVSNNGIPRETKIYEYFPNKSLAIKLLHSYNSLNKSKLDKIELTCGAFELINKLKKNNKEIHILSGGDFSEVIFILKKYKLDNLFKSISTGPLTKIENLKRTGLKENCILIGDSRADYEVATKSNMDFIFMTDYTQFSEWKEFFSNKQNVYIINNLNQIL